MPQIKRIPTMRVAFVSNTGPYGQVVQQGIGKLFAWLESNHQHPAGASLAIFYDDPAEVAPEMLKSESCVVVAPSVMGSGAVTVKNIGGFEAATIEYRGEANIEKAYGEIYPWLHAQGYHDSGAPLETYLSRPGEELHAEIAIPVAKAKPAPAAKKKPSRPKKKTPKKPARKPAKKAKRTAKKRKR